jgi:hypothetical protein
LHAGVQLAGGELSNGLFRSSTAGCQCRSPWLVQRNLPTPYAERHLEHGLRIKLHFDANYVSDELRPIVIHPGTIVGARRRSDGLLVLRVRATSQWVGDRLNRQTKSVGRRNGKPSTLSAPAAQHLPIQRQANTKAVTILAR